MLCLLLASRGAPRPTFYLALLAGLLMYGPHLAFFWTIFGPPAVVRWGILAAWLALFVVLFGWLVGKWGVARAVWMAPVLWMAVEYFRSELYLLRFSWLSLGYAFSEAPWIFARTGLGVYGVGLMIALLGGLAWRGSDWRWRAGIVVASGVLLAFLATERAPGSGSPGESVTVRAAGLQLEYPLEDELVRALNEVALKHPDAALVVLSEYTLQRPPADAIRQWCRENKRYLVVGGRDALESGAFYNTAFVIGPDGEVIFKQAKSVPIQFFADGLPAPRRRLWNSPWGAIGIGICYDLSYRRVMDDFVGQGAQALVIPTADESQWGERQHALHARVARVRAAEYGVPIFRVAGSGISQHVDAGGRELATAPYPGQGEIMVSQLAFGGPGHLPVDHWLAPLSVGAVLLLIAATLLKPHLKRRCAATLRVTA
jgi:apolipoprotein N-acyltransferase